MKTAIVAVVRSSRGGHSALFKGKKKSPISDWTKGERQTTMPWRTWPFWGKEIGVGGPGERKEGNHQLRRLVSAAEGEF